MIKNDCIGLCMFDSTLQKPEEYLQAVARYEGVTQAIPIECFTYTYLYVSRPLLGKESTSYRYGLVANIVAR